MAKFFLRTCLVIVAVLALAILSSVWWFHLDDYRSDIEAAINQGSPLQLSLGGPIEYSLLSPYQIRLTNISVHYKDESLLILPQLEITLKEIDLFSRYLNVDTIHFHRPALTVHNSQLASIAQEVNRKRIEPATSKQPTALPIRKLAIGQLSIDGLSFIWSDAEHPVELHNLDLDIVDWSVFKDGQFQLEKQQLSTELQLASGKYQQEQIRHLHIRGSLAKGTIQVAALDAKLLGGNLSTSGTIQLENGISIDIKQLRAADLTINDETWQLNRDSDRKPGSETETNEDATSNLKSLIKSFHVSNATFRNIDVTLNRLARPITLSKLEIVAKNLLLTDDYQWLSLQPLVLQPFELDISADSASWSDYIAKSPNLIVHGGQPVQLKTFSIESNYGTLSGEGTLESQKNVLPFSVKLNANQLDLSLLDLFELESNLTGKVDLLADLTGQANPASSFLSGLNGAISLQSKSDVLYDKLDLDRTIDSLLASQELTVTDVAAFAVLGPFGIFASKGTAVTSMAANSMAKGQTYISDVLITAHFDNGALDLDEAAFATKKHLYALFGRLDLVNNSFEAFKTTVLDTENCIRFAQNIDGPFNKPNFQIASAVTGTATGLFTNAFKDTKKYFGKNCEPAYTGPVKHPKLIKRSEIKVKNQPKS